MHRFFYENLKNSAVGMHVELERAEASHLFKILRARTGDHVGLLDGKGIRADAEVCADRTLKILSREMVEIPEKRIHIFLAPPRKQKMDQALKQLGELGVWSITPVICERSVVQLDGPAAPDSWNEHLKESCKQSGNPFLPEQGGPLNVRDAVAKASGMCEHVFFGDPAEHAERGIQLTGDIGLFIGPEGGFSPAELDLLKQAGFLPLRIGNWILRVETAAVAGLAVLTARESI